MPVRIAAIRIAQGPARRQGMPGGAFLATREAFGAKARHQHQPRRRSSQAAQVAHQDAAARTMAFGQAIEARQQQADEGVGVQRQIGGSSPLQCRQQRTQQGAAVLLVMAATRRDEDLAQPHQASAPFRHRLGCIGGPLALRFLHGLGETGEAGEDGGAEAGGPVEGRCAIDDPVAAFTRHHRAEAEAAQRETEMPAVILVALGPGALRRVHPPAETRLHEPAHGILAGGQGAIPAEAFRHQWILHQSLHVGDAAAAAEDGQQAAQAGDEGRGAAGPRPEQAEGQMHLLRRHRARTGLRFRIGQRFLARLGLEGRRHQRRIGRWIRQQQQDVLVREGRILIEGLQDAVAADLQFTHGAAAGMDRH